MIFDKQDHIQYLKNYQNRLSLSSHFDYILLNSRLNNRFIKMKIQESIY